MSDEEQVNTALEEDKTKRRSSRKSKSRYQTQEQQQTKETTPSSPSLTAGKQKTKPKNPGGQEEGVGDDDNSSDKSPNEDQPLSQLKNSNKKQSKSSRSKGKTSGRPRKPKTVAPSTSTEVVVSGSPKTEVIEIIDDDTEEILTAEEADPVVEQPSPEALSSSFKVDIKDVKTKDAVESPLVKLKKIECARKKEFNFVPKLPKNLANPTTLATIVDSDDESCRQIPIFTKQFLEYNKKKENELQQITKTRRELNHNNQLMKANQDNYDQSMIQQKEKIAAKRAELARKKENLRNKYHKYQVQFEYIQLPTNPQLNVMTDPEAYVKELGKILQENDPSKRNFFILAHARLQGMFNI